MIVKFFATYREYANCSMIEMPAPENVVVLLRSLGERYGSEFREKLLSDDGQSLGNDAIVMVNGRHIEHLDGVNTPLSDDDTVAVFPLVAGG